MDEIVFNHAQTRQWWDGPDRFYCVNRNVIGNCQARTVQEMIAALYKGKVGFDMGGPGFKASDGRYCRGLDLYHGESVRGDILNLPLKNECLDFIVTFHVLEHVEDIRKALSEFIRVLKHDGVIYAVMPDRRHFSHGYDPNFARGVNAPNEMIPEEMLSIIKEYKELEILLFDTHLNNLDFNMFLRKV